MEEVKERVKKDTTPVFEDIVDSLHGQVKMMRDNVNLISMELSQVQQTDDDLRTEEMEEKSGNDLKEKGPDLSELRYVERFARLLDELDVLNRRLHQIGSKVSNLF